MKFYRNKLTGEMYEKDLTFFNEKNKAEEYDEIFDYQLGYLMKISDRLGWIIGFLAIQFILIIIGVVYYFL